MNPATELLALIAASRANAELYVHPGSNHFYLCAKGSGYLLKTLGDSADARALVETIADQLNEVPRRNEALKVLVDGMERIRKGSGFAEDEAEEALSRAMAILKGGGGL